MILMYTMTYPTTSAVEFGKAVAKNYQEHPLPDFMRLNGAYSLVYEDGCKTIAIVEIEEGKEGDAFKVFNKRLSNYLRVPGFGWKEEILRTFEESFSIVGLDTP